MAACGGDDGSGGDPFAPETIAGTYTLQSIAGETLPWTLFAIPGTTLEFLSGSIRLNSDRTFSRSFTFRVTENGAVTTETETDTGAFVQNASAIVFNSSDGSQESASLTGNVLTVIREGVAYVFRR